MYENLVATCFAVANSAVILGIVGWLIGKKVLPLLRMNYMRAHDQEQALYNIEHALNIRYLHEQEALKQEAARLQKLRDTCIAWQRIASENRCRQEQESQRYRAYLQDKIIARAQKTHDTAVQNMIFKAALDQAEEDLYQAFKEQKEREEYTVVLVAHLPPKGHA